MIESLARAGRVLCLAGLLLAAPRAGAQFIVDAVPGGVVEIPLAPAAQPRPEAYFGQRRILVTQFARRWVGLVGLPLNLTPGSYLIQVKAPDSEKLEPREFTVYPRRSTGQSVVALPGPPVAAPEQGFVWREPLDAELPLGSPVALPARPVFGVYREAASSEPAYADFVSFQIAADTPVTAPDAGRVAGVARRESGVYVWIDHGMAFYTRIGPLTAAALDPSDTVEAGQPIGRVQPDEQDTPQILYLSVFLNGAAVNPFLVSEIDKTNGNGGAPGEVR